jgi:hypothetical protein
MADRTSAHLFGQIFNHLAETPDERSVTFARVVWGLMEEGGYDFNHYQMDADEALVKLDLARPGHDDWCEEGCDSDDCMVYGPKPTTTQDPQ